MQKDYELFLISSVASSTFFSTISTSLMEFKSSAFRMMNSSRAFWALLASIWGFNNVFTARIFFFGSGFWNSISFVNSVDFDFDFSFARRNIENRNLCPKMLTQSGLQIFVLVIFLGGALAAAAASAVCIKCQNILNSDIKAINTVVPIQKRDHRPNKGNGNCKSVFKYWIRNDQFSDGK